MATCGNMFDPLECTICLESFVDPKLLPCFHTFCLDCIERHVKQTGVGTLNRQGITFTCPMCRKDTFVPDGGAQNFQTNFYIDAVKKQQSPEQLKSKRNRIAKLESLDLMLVDTTLNNSGDHKKVETVCVHVPQHQGDLFCNTCLQTTCARCGSSHHRQHQLTFVELEYPATIHRLAELRFKASQIAKYLLQVQIDCCDYSQKVLRETGDIKSKLKKQREEIHSLVDEKFNELLRNLQDNTQKELDQVRLHKASVDELIQQTTLFGNKAERAQKNINLTDMARTEKHVYNECMKILKAIPSFLQGKMLFKLNKPQNPVSSILTTQNLFGTIVSELSTQPTHADHSLNDDSDCDSHSLNSKMLPSSLTVCSQSDNDVCSLEGEQQTQSFQAEGGNSNSSKMSAAKSPILLSPPETIIYASKKPRVVGNFHTETQGEIKHIVPLQSDKAWISYGQADSILYLMNMAGTTTMRQNAGGGVQDVAILRKNVLLLATPASRKLKTFQIQDYDDDGDTRNLTSFRDLPFPATCVVVGRPGIAVAGKLNIVVISKDATRMTWVLKGEEFLKKPCSITYSLISGFDILAVADPGSKTVYIFSKDSNPATVFHNNPILYTGEGIVDDDSQKNFIPVSVSGREGLLAVLDKATETVALLGNEFSVVSIIKLGQLLIMETWTIAIAFNSFHSSCNRMWLGTTSGQICVIELPLSSITLVP